ncbi:MAG: hypothetical protein JXA71_00605 [Chitinispirillaceae bacterium]|nr:hypothetical protein [Chitinispirillaceae bacterium]
MISRIHPLLILLTVLLPAFPSDIRNIQADFDRCVSLMERVERSLRSFEDRVVRLKQQAGHMESDVAAREKSVIEALEGRVDYFRNRLDRANGLADKTRDDLRNVNGPVCPTCVVSSVNLYCRSAEMLQTDTDEYALKASDIETRLSGAAGGGDTQTSFERDRRSIDSLVIRHRARLDSCADRAGKTLWQQALLNLRRADSLAAAGEAARAVRSLRLSRDLMGKAKKKCGLR